MACARDIRSRQAAQRLQKTAGLSLMLMFLKYEFPKFFFPESQ